MGETGRADHHPLIPDPYSAYGFTARMTPHWVHVLFYRLILGWKNAGKPGYGPYKVTYDRWCRAKAFEAFCEENGLVLAAEYGMPSSHGLNSNGAGSSWWKRTKTLHAPVPRPPELRSQRHHLYHPQTGSSREGGPLQVWHCRSRLICGF